MKVGVQSVICDPVLIEIIRPDLLGSVKIDISSRCGELKAPNWVGKKSVKCRNEDSLTHVQVCKWQSDNTGSDGGVERVSSNIQKARMILTFVQLPLR